MKTKNKPVFVALRIDNAMAAKIQAVVAEKQVNRSEAIRLLINR